MKTPINRFLYKLTDRLGTIVVVPLNENDFSLEYQRENDDKLDYEKKLSGKIMFVGDAFKRLMIMENSAYRCEEQVLSIYKICKGVEVLHFTGRISLNDADFNLNRCTITMKFLDDNSDKCIEDGKNLKLNLFQLIYDRITVKTASFVGAIETKNCSKSSPNIIDIPTDYWCGGGDPYSQNWTLVSYQQSSPDGVHHFVKNVWKREIIEVSCSQEINPLWVLVEDNCGTTGKKKFAKTVSLFDCVVSSEPENEFGSFYYSMDCKVLGYDGGTTSLKNGLHFSEVMQEILKGACPNLTLKSDFFQINPEVVSNLNYVTGKESTTRDIIIFQKSDVKRPTATGSATKLEIELEKILEILLQVFNVKWRIVGGFFILEHISYFSKNVGFDITSEDLKKYFVGKMQYTYDNANIPQKETFRFKEQQGGDWNLEVVYKGCVTNKKKNEVPILVDGAMTDIVFAISNPDSDSKLVDDLGFCMVSSKKISDEYFINSEASPNGSRLNNVFSWVALFRDFHYYERPMKVGSVNGVTTNFISSIPTKKGERFAIPYNVCKTIFNPDNFVKTLLGDGIVSSAKHRFKDEFLELELLYESNNDLVPNIPPVLEGAGVYSTYKNIPKIIEIEATDADGFITSVIVTRPPSNGTIEVLSFTQIRYISNSDFVGLDTFSLQAVDNYSELSNVANFIVNVLNENLPPVAVDDNYFVWIGETFVQGTSIFENDSDDFDLFTLETPNVTTVQGVAVAIDEDGFFAYVPPSGFEGNDTFVYSIKDDLNNVSSATVTLKVAYKNKPVAVDDNYQVSKDNVLTADGSGSGKQKLTANDYTPDGGSYTYTTNAETKATTAGGSVVINTDGTFIFTPLTGFVGNDSFDYTVNNSNGSDVGTAKIAVLPTIYVKLTTNDLTTSGKPVTRRTQDYILNFYSDASGLVHFDVTGLNFKVKIKDRFTLDNVQNYIEIWETSILTGTSTKILDDFEFYFVDEINNNNNIERHEISVEAGAYQVI